MSDPFNLTGLSPLFTEATKRDEKTMAFEVKNGRGRFLFLMFFDADDFDTYDQLFVYMRNTNFMMNLKLYGNHQKGDFKVYIQSWQEKKIIEELEILNSSSCSSFMLIRFLENLNKSFPTSLPFRKTIECLQDNWREIKTKLPDKLVKDEDKTVLIGEKKVSIGSPQEKTLRKLYLHTEGDPEDIALLIKYLKSANMTVAWTTEESGRKSENIRNLINQI